MQHQRRKNGAYEVPVFGIASLLFVPLPKNKMYKILGSKQSLTQLKNPDFLPNTCPNSLGFIVRPLKWQQA